MGKYTIFSDVAKTIVDMLKDQIVPEPLDKAENIGVCAPNDRENFVVGIHPYDLKENNEMGMVSPTVLPNGYIKDAPKSYQLSLFISVASKAEAMVKSLEESRILGRVLQVINDNKTLPTKYMPEALRDSGESISINMIPLDVEEKIKIWSLFNEPYKQSAFFEVGPILLESATIKVPSTRVKSITLESQQSRRERER